MYILICTFCNQSCFWLIMIQLRINTVFMLRTKPKFIHFLYKNTNLINSEPTKPKLPITTPKYRTHFARIQIM